jgi:glycosyltransferase involved in cell wall biosynthesis
LDRTLLKALRRDTYARVVVIGALIPSQTAIDMLLFATGVPRLCFPHGILTNPSKDFRFGGRRRRSVGKIAKQLGIRCLALPLVRNASGVRALSAYEALELRPRGSCLTLSDGCDDSWFIPATRSPLDTGPNFLFLGRQEPFQKGLDLLVGAIDSIMETGRFPNARFKIVGPSNWQTDAVRLDSRSIATGYLEVHGEVQGDEKQTLFSWGHYFLHPSRYEGMARAPREAVSQGLPLIASRESNFGDWILQGEFGYVCELTAESLADAISMACQAGDEEYARMSQAARRFAERRRWPQVAAELDVFLRGEPL